MCSKTESNETENFIYSKDSTYLTDEQRRFYEENGYVIIKKLVDDELLEECKDRFLKLCNDRKSDVKVMLVMKDPYLKANNEKGEYVVNKVHDFVHDEIFFKYASYEPIVNIVESIIGPNITVFHSMLINKPPNSKQELSKLPLHQDLHYFPFRPVDLMVSVWTAMEPVTKENGCLVGVPGSHKGQHYEHDYISDLSVKAYQGAVGLGNLDLATFVMDKGDTIFFHPLLLHGSGPNTTKGFRKSISCCYRDSLLKTIPLKGTIQEKIEKEILEIGENMGLGKTTIENFFKVKSVVLKGEPGNL
ncbi:hypothetical protein FQA39_LY03105 [Lamprigera yunnana]|nr:hypothetical protein FQA39_LY03105 [Lamprigera yunnana]